MVGQLNLGLEERGGGMGGERDLGGDARVELLGASAQAAPLEPEAEVAVVPVVADAVGELGAVAVGHGDGVATAGGDGEAPEEAVGGSVGGIDELGLSLGVMEREDIAVGGGDGEADGGVEEDDAVGLLSLGGSGLVVGVRAQWPYGLVEGSEESLGPEVVCGSGLRRGWRTCRTTRERASGSRWQRSWRRPRRAWM